MTSVICLIQVIISVGGVNIYSDVQTSGKLLKEQDGLYLVDFSKNAKENNWQGNDYNRMLVSKDKCVKE